MYIIIYILLKLYLCMVQYNVHCVLNYLNTFFSKELLKN